MENLCVEFEGIVYQQIVGIHMGTNRALLIADLVLFCYEKILCLTFTYLSKQHSLIDMFDDTSRYLDDTFTIDNS